MRARNHQPLAVAVGLGVLVLGVGVPAALGLAAHGRDLGVAEQLVQQQHVVVQHRRGAADDDSPVAPKVVLAGRVAAVTQITAGRHRVEQTRLGPVVVHLRHDPLLVRLGPRVVPVDDQALELRRGLQLVNAQPVRLDDDARALVPARQPEESDEGVVAVVPHCESVALVRGGDRSGGRPPPWPNHQTVSADVHRLVRRERQGEDSHVAENVTWVAVAFDTLRLPPVGEVPRGVGLVLHRAYGQRTSRYQREARDGRPT